eukprot:CAMPEP_0170620220 /NCGR_PEP_ID=MMETSP0224-20130122/27940_1 /TAXON_ID=285029 /ORGANISM="Togula jolla, Strain CCCM 725" /LENGTH=171 /DNA_ID=CAMNT_0010946375 /DNA_START=24 /DNA_END=539 /DNA_ORIENTATION=-
MERENTDSSTSWQPLLPMHENVAVPEGLPPATEEARAVAEALMILRQPLSMLQGRREVTKAETAELLRDMCETLRELATDIQRSWQRQHPGELAPAWAVEEITGEELARIGWDFHANRVQMNNTGASLWESVAILLSGDQSRSYAKPPSAAEVVKALTRASSRLRSDEPYF